MSRLNNRTKALDYIGTTIIGLVSLFYSIFGIAFAELNISFPSLNFPIFIGEITLLTCLILLIIKWVVSYQKFDFWYWAIFIYISFILAKVFFGYLRWGSLAFRHAALFYYPIFAICSYSFFRIDYFKIKINKILIPILLFISMFLTSNSSYVFIFFILAIVLIISYPLDKIKYLFMFSFILFTPYRCFFGGQRAMWASNAISIFFIISVLMIILKIRKIFKVILYTVFITVLGLVIINLTIVSGLGSILNLKKNIEVFNTFNNVVLSEKKHFLFIHNRKINLYNKGAQSLSPEGGAIIEPVIEVYFSRHEDRFYEELLQTSNDIQLTFKQSPGSLFQQTRSQEQGQDRLNDYQLQIETKQKWLNSIAQKVKNTVKLKNYSLGKNPGSYFLTNSFRIFIWEDVLEQLWLERPIFGFDFGRPFRSKSLEVLSMALGEWARDGWVATHNSYLEIIYRAGIVGFILIIAIFLTLFKMIKMAIFLRSIKGVLLCAVLIPWLVAANFTLILEMPYNAITFWCCFGMVFGYLSKEYGLTRSINKREIKYD